MEDLDWDSMTTTEVVTKVIQISRIVAGLLGNNYPHRFVAMSVNPVTKELWFQYRRADDSYFTTNFQEN